MIRKLIVCCIVDHAGAYEAESEVDWGFVTHQLGMEVRELSCDNHWDVTIDANGEGTLDAEGIFPHPNDTGSLCETMEPCAHVPWPLELEENATGNPLEVHVTFCLEGTTLSTLDNVPFAIECAYDDVTDAMHCDAPIAGGSLEVEGEVLLHPSPETGELPIVSHG